MDKVVYFLGAGFSAPLGLPVMRNFLIRSKDMFFEDPKRYDHFKAVFDTIDAMAVAKNYYSADLFNIEEILSMLEMAAHLEEEQLKVDFLQYIKDVIEYYTPDIEPYHGRLPGNWYKFIFGQEQLFNQLGYFIGNLLNLEIEEKEEGTRQFHWARQSKPDVQYAIVTLNYDLVPEKICDYIKNNYEAETDIEFIQGSKGNDLAHVWDLPSMAKLHGSIDMDVIVPPTWNKSNHVEIIQTWKHAYHLLVEATHIRFLGYSLPEADAYVRYLLKSAVLKAPHMKRIDVLCLDNEEIVEDRYDEFIEFDYYRFLNTNVTDYLSHIYKKHQEENQNQLKRSGVVRKVTFDQLEVAHKDLCGSD